MTTGTCYSRFLNTVGVLVVCLFCTSCIGRYYSVGTQRYINRARAEAAYEASIQRVLNSVKRFEKPLSCRLQMAYASKELHKRHIVYTGSKGIITEDQKDYIASMGYKGQKVFVELLQKSNITESIEGVEVAEAGRVPRSAIGSYDFVLIDPFEQNGFELRREDGTPLGRFQVTGEDASTFLNPLRQALERALGQQATKKPSKAIITNFGPYDVPLSADREQYELRFDINSGTLLKLVEVRCGNKVVYTMDTKKANGPFSWNQSEPIRIPLAEGKNIIRITVVDQNDKAAEPVTITVIRG